MTEILPHGIKEIDHCYQLLMEATGFLFHKCKIEVIRYEMRESSDVIYANLTTDDFDTSKYLIGSKYLNSTIIIEEYPFIKFSIFLSSADIIRKSDLRFIDVELFVKISAPKIFYENYINSTQWKNFRIKLFKERGFKCELCGSKKNLQVHHITYENLSTEKDDDVLILCQVCHQKAHS